MAEYPKRIEYTLVGGLSFSKRIYSPKDQSDQERWKRTNCYSTAGSLVLKIGEGLKVTAYKIVDNQGNVEKVWFRGWE